MKRKKFFLLSLLLLLGFLITGCGGAGETGDTAVGNTVITKGEWIGLLGDKFGYNAYEATTDFYTDVDPEYEYYDEVQACAEWEILPEETDLNPEEAATWEYAIETSVRAIGLDKLNKSDVGMEVTEDNLVEFFTQNIADINGGDAGTGSLDMELSETDAQLILSYAYTYACNLTLPQRLEYTYNVGVTEAAAEDITLNEDGSTAVVQSGEYEPGDIVYIPPTEQSPAYAIQVESVEDGQITYESVGMEEVYEELQVSGTFEATVVNVQAAEGVTISEVTSSGNMFAFASYGSDVGSPEANTGVYVPDKESGKAAMMASDGGNDVSFNADLGDGVSLNVALSDIVVTSDVDFGVFAGLRKADVTVSFHDQVEAKYTADHYSKTVTLGTVEVLLGATPLTAEFSIIANIGFDGEVTLTYASDIVANVNYTKGNGLAKSVSNNNPECDFHAEATVTAEPTIKAELCCLGRGLVNAKVTSGVVAVATADIDLLGNEPACIDIYLYVPLRWAINEDGCLMTSISSKLQASGVVWDSENSPVNQRFHWEDGVLVAACTRGSGNEVETDTTDEDGEPYDEYKLFDFEEIIFGSIRVSAQMMYLSVGETQSIQILYIPGGYSDSDLIFNVEDTSVCSVSGGAVTAAGSGRTTIHISTPDRLYNAFVSVIVEEEYNDTSGFQPL